jgi:hypothetical protein
MFRNDDSDIFLAQCYHSVKVSLATTTITTTRKKTPKEFCD